MSKAAKDKKDRGSKCPDTVLQNRHEASADFGQCISPAYIYNAHQTCVIVINLLDDSASKSVGLFVVSMDYELALKDRNVPPQTRCIA